VTVDWARRKEKDRPWLDLFRTRRSYKFCTQPEIWQGQR